MSSEDFFLLGHREYQHNGGEKIALPIFHFVDGASNPCLFEVACVKRMVILPVPLESTCPELKIEDFCFKEHLQILGEPKYLKKSKNENKSRLPLTM